MLSDRVCCVFFATILVASSGSSTAQPCDPVETDKLTATGGFPLEEMGTSIAVDGDVMATGAVDIGAVYIFRRAGGTWSQEARLTPAGASAGPDFGRSVAVMGNRVVVGAPLDFGTGTDSGAVYIFRNTGGSSWVQEQRLTPDGAGFNDDFGFAVAARNGLILAGMPGDVVGPSFGAGSVRVFELNTITNAWTETATLIAGSPESGARFGSAVDVDGQPGDETAVIGAPLATTTPGVQSGRAYLFRSDPGPSRFIEQGELPEQSLVDGNLFGSTVAVSGNSAAVGSPGRRLTSFFGFSPVSIALNSGFVVLTDSFPASVALDGDVVLMGNPLVDGSRGETFVGFFIDSDFGLSPSRAAADRAISDQFGAAVALQGDEAFVGAPFEDENGLDAGAVYVFDLNCIGDCVADTNSDGMLSPADFNGWILAYNSSAPTCDQNGDGRCTPADFNAWILNFNAGC